MNFLYKTLHIIYFAELEEEAEQQGEVLYREIEVGTDGYVPSALGKLCDRFIYLREG